MKLISFPEQTVVIANDQPQYNPLPAYRDRTNPQGKLICCWRLTWKERLKLLFSGVIWHSILTFNGPLQPQLLSVEKPSMLPPENSRILSVEEIFRGSPYDS